MTELGVVIDGKYEILKEIGRGGMSIVYLAMDKRLNKQWAVKEIKKQTNDEKNEIVINSLLAEANLMKRLDHPSLPRIVDIIDNGLTIYIVMDYIEGESLDKVLKEYGAQPEQLVINWAKQLCDALSYLHMQKPPIIYRDMKPANVMLKPEGNIKIIDFGIAREYKEQNLADTTVLGTKGYAPPEQYSGQTDARADIFALGMTMHHLLSGKDPRVGDAYVPVRYYNSQLSEGIEIIIDNCVQPVAENRYQTCEDLLYDLEHPELITKDFKRKQKRKMSAFIITSVLCVIMLITGIVTNSLAIAENNSNYTNLVESVDSIENYKKAIEIYPERTEAYFKMIEVYENTKFTKEENDEFLAYYNANKDKMDQNSAEVALLNYEIGLMYYNYYVEDENSTDNKATRINKAYPFFEANATNEQISDDFTEKYLSDCYYQICKFYKEYILTSAKVEEASKSDYEELFNIIEETLIDVQGAGAYDQLVLYNAVFMLIYDQRESMATVNMDMDQVLELFDEVYERAKSVSTQKEQSQKLKNDMVNNYDDYREAIERTYINVNERS